MSNLTVYGASQSQADDASKQSQPNQHDHHGSADALNMPHSLASFYY
ncbi:MAG: hypothetical protein ACPGYX_09055 [Oceanobacter sp.]